MIFKINAFMAVTSRRSLVYFNCTTAVISLRNTWRSPRLGHPMKHASQSCTQLDMRRNDAGSQ